MNINKMELISSHPIKKSDIGFHGNLFGGQLMCWIDLAGATYAMEKCYSRKMVTLSIDKCLFKNPAKEGEVLKIYGKILAIGNTSITLSLEAKSYNFITSEETLTLSTNIKFVNLNEEGKSNPISDRTKKEFKNKIFESLVGLYQAGLEDGCSHLNDKGESTIKTKPIQGESGYVKYCTQCNASTVYDER